MFKVGDIVEITEESDATGMLGFKKGNGYEVVEVNILHSSPLQQVFHIKVIDDGGRALWYTPSHFKLKREEVMEDGVKFKIGDTLVCTETNPVELSANSITTGEEYVVTGLWEGGVCIVNDDGGEVGVCDYRFKLKEDTIVEKKECLFKEGQTVYCPVFGKGVISSVSLIDDEIHVEFSGITSFNYDVNGIIYGGTSRSLFFSPPVVTGATEPVFEPTLKKGDLVVLSDNTAQAIVKVVNETDTELFYEGDGAVTFINKDCVSVHRLGEKINFK